MSRPAAAARRSAHAARSTGRTLRPVPGPRRASGPSKSRAAAATAAPGILAGAAGIAQRLPDSRALDRLIRGRAWVGVIAVALIGIVAMQVHMLGLNAGIGRSVDKATTLEQQNTTLRLQVSRLSSGERIAAEAQKLGLVMPNAGEVRYTDARDTDAARAARTMKAPDPDLAAQAKEAVQAGVGTGASALAPESAATAPGEAPGAVPTGPATPDPAQTTAQPPAATQQAQAPAAQQQQPVEQQQPQPVVQQQQPVVQQQQPVQQQQTPTQTVTPAGGAAATPGG